MGNEFEGTKVVIRSHNSKDTMAVRKIGSIEPVVAQHRC